MKEFVFIFRLNNTAGAKPTPEQLQERLNWLAGLAAQDRLADRGNTLALQNARLVRAGEQVTEGPHMEVSEFATGYMVVKAADIDEAVGFARSNPIFKVGGSVEVREVVKRT